jgi:hypothetical protein
MTGVYLLSRLGIEILSLGIVACSDLFLRLVRIDGLQDVGSLYLGLAMSMLFVAVFPVWEESWGGVLTPGGNLVTGKSQDANYRRVFDSWIMA